MVNIVSEFLGINTQELFELEVRQTTMVYVAQVLNGTAKRSWAVAVGLLSPQIGAGGSQ